MGKYRNSIGFFVEHLRKCAVSFRHPPNLLITENTYITQHGVNFLTFAMHMSIGVVIALLVTNIHLRIQCRNLHKLVKIQNKEPSELEVWQKKYDDLESMNENDDNYDSIGDLEDLKLILAKKINSLKEVEEADSKIGLIHRKFNKKTFPESLEQLKNMVQTLIIID